MSNADFWRDLSIVKGCRGVRSQNFTDFNIGVNSHGRDYTVGRRRRGSNPCGSFPPQRFPGVPIRPLSHSSVNLILPLFWKQR